MTFLEAEKILNKKQTKKIANNTYLRRVSEHEIHVEFHGSSILRLFPNCVIYDSCGWRTATTKARLNTFGVGGISIYSEHKKWFIFNNSTRSRVPFEDGVIFEY